MSDAASERVKAAIWTGKNFCRVTILAKAVSHMSKICKTWQISVEAALPLAACLRNLRLAAPVPSRSCSIHGRHRSTGSAQENQLRAVFRVWAARGLPHITACQHLEPVRPVPREGPWPCTSCTGFPRQTTGRR